MKAMLAERVTNNENTLGTLMTNVGMNTDDIATLGDMVMDNVDSIGNVVSDVAANTNQLSDVASDVATLMDSAATMIGDTLIESYFETNAERIGYTEEDIEALEGPLFLVPPFCVEGDTVLRFNLHATIRTNEMFGGSDFAMDSVPAAIAVLVVNG